jgi:hypothetical protein
MIAQCTPALSALTRLRKLDLTAEQARSVWELALCRQRAHDRFGEEAARLYFDRDGLEMASSSLTACYHAELLRRCSFRTVIDLTAGIGMDAIAFARAGLTVVAYERDPVRSTFARANVRALCLGQQVEVRSEDVASSILPAADVVYADPSRRSAERRRIVSLVEIDPPLSLVASVAREMRGALVKLSPAIDRGTGDSYGGQLAFISAAGECKEALLKLGALADGSRISAVLLPGDETISEGANATLPLGPPDGDFLYEPDPAVIRAGLAATLAAQLDAWLIDPNVAYLVGNRYVPTPFARAYRIEESFAFSIKALQSALTTRGAGSVIIKKRGFPEDPDDVRKRLKLSGANEVTAALTRIGNRHWAFILAEGIIRR